MTAVPGKSALTRLFPGGTVTGWAGCSKSTENGFFVRHTHPNLFFISWNHNIPFYQRDIIRTSTGVKVDGLGNIISKKENKMICKDFGLKRSEIF